VNRWFERGSFCSALGREWT